jgi:mRNA (guanine-N7-)-methyltransferase
LYRLAAEYNMYPVYKKEFHEVFEDFKDHAEFEPLLQRMKVVDSNGETDMDEDQWEAASAWPIPSRNPARRRPRFSRRYLRRLRTGKEG